MTKKKHAKRAPARRPTTALAHRPAVSPVQVQVLPAESKRELALPDPSTILGDEATLGALGLEEIKLKPEEELVLNRAVALEEVRVKPTGQPYLSHPTYTRWFNEAFGRLGWAIVQRAKPMKTGDSVIVPYLLYIHGKPAAFAWGEQEYFESNREQTYGDALEATVANALRRCAKRLGVGLELWDKVWIDAYIRAHCVRVKVIRSYRGQKKAAYQWRRKIDPPFYNEVKAKGDREVETYDDEQHEVDPLEYDRPAPAQRRAAPPIDEKRGAPPAEERSVGYNPKADEVITQAQRQRLWVIVRNSGRNENTVKAWLQARYGWDSTKAIRRRFYDEICKAIEARGALDMTPRRTPGEEG